LEDKKVLYITSHRFLDHLKWTKNEKDMEFENKKGYIKKIETKYHICPLPPLHVFFLAPLFLVFRENL
jgi:hypothetical protein